MMDQDYTGMDQDMLRQQSANMKKKSIRCTFWPNCEKGEQCPFLHPNKPCTAFPQCPYGQKCHFVHPNCRYDGFCTRLDCPFTHNVKKTTSNMIPSVSATTDMQVQVTTTTTPVVSDGGVISKANEIAATTTATPTTTPVKSTGPKITINKIQQPYYSLVNKSATSNGGQVISTTITTMNTTAGQDLQMAPVVAGQRPFSFASKPFHATPNSFMASANQYMLINRTNTTPTIPIVSTTIHAIIGYILFPIKFD